MCIRDRIVLLHSHFESDTGTLRMCSNGAIVGRSLRVEDNNSYTSQLNVTIGSDMIGESIECIHTPSATDVIVVGSSTINAITGQYA